jgi:glycosyltransferase 2 family protein
VTKWQRVRPGTLRGLWRWVRLAGGVLVIGLVVSRLGARPFLDGLRQVDTASVAAALTITAGTTVISAWRWRLIAAGLGLSIPLRNAVASYYRSQFLNSTLPGGVMGDLHRGLLHGRRADDVSRGLRSVAWDRAAGQVVQVTVAGVALLLLPSALRPPAGITASLLLGLAVLAGVAALVASALRRAEPAPGHRVRRALAADARAVVPDARAGTAIVITSLLVVAGHVAVFLVAAHAAGVAASTSELVSIALLVLLATTLPTSVGGWGPREGVAAWAFAAAGLSAAQGVETATVFGVLGLVAALPGAAVLLAARRPSPPSRCPAPAPPTEARSLVSIGAGRLADG